ncbi:MAG: META domain-containing protein [Halothiobacillaceae bacterium]
MRLLAMLFALLQLTLTPLHAKETAFPATLPISYQGTLPCADCSGIDTRLNLLPDGQFQMRMTYLGREGSGVYSIGLWQFKDGKLTLKDGTQTVEQFQIKDKTLTKLDMQGQPIASKLNYSLQSKRIFQPLKPKLTLQGMFVYFADAAIFTPCATEKPMPVRMEGDYLALEKAYMSTRKEPQQALLATLEGEIFLQPRMEGEGNELALRVLQFKALDSASACPAPAAQIEDRTWVVVQLGEQTISPPKEGLGAHLILLSKEQRVAGSGGCNRLMGGYTLKGDTLKFSKMASTMMFCEKSMDTEQNFLRALDKVTSGSMDADMLILKDSNGKVLIKLRAKD